MASVDSATNNPNDPNNPNNAPGAVNQPGQQNNQPATTAGGAGPVTATGSGNVTGQVTGTANPSQPFQNISSYLAANAPQSQQLAGQVANTVSQPITQAQEGITNAANTFTQSVNAGYTPENKDLISAVSNNPAYVVAENPQNVTNFQANLNDKYTGPTDFTQLPGYADLQTQIANAQTQAANTQNEAGIQTLLQNVEGPTTAGINKLDSLLLTANPQNITRIQNAGAGAANLLPTLNQTATDQNALAAGATTNASTAASDAAAALQAALTGETGNLTNEQNTIQGIVDAYNKSVGVISPVTQTIAQDIQNFLAANPNLSLSDATSALAPLMNLQPITMPTESNYASPTDYATIAALASLGIDPSALAGLPINSSTASQAQTFQLPTQLQDALGKAPGVESALSSELNTLGGEINTDISGFKNASDAANAAQSAYSAIVGPSTPGNAITNGSFNIKAGTPLYDSSGKAVPPTISQSTPGKGGVPVVTQVPNPAYQALLDQAKQAYLQFSSAQNAMRQDAPGLQWVNGASTGYNDLISQINAELGQLGNVGVPTLTYSPNTVTDPVTGAPIGAVTAADVGKIANTAAAGATGAAGIGAGILAGTEVPGEALATGSLGPGASIGAGLQAAGTVAAPAALAAYGGSNILQNFLNNPLQTGLETLGNTLTLGAMSLPPQIFNSIGKEINSVINDIGSFFGNLF